MPENDPGLGDQVCFVKMARTLITRAQIGESEFWGLLGVEHLK